MNISKKIKIISIAIILAVVGLSVVSVKFMKDNSRMETDLDEYMPKTHPAFVYSDQAEEWFNIRDGILIAVENKNGIYNPKSLQKIKDISKQLQDMEGFADNDINSIYTADNITGSEFGMDVVSFYKRVPKSDDALAKLKQDVRDNEMVYERFVSKDETVALIVASMEDSLFNEDFYNEILEFANSFEDEENKIYVAGRPIVEGTMALLGPEDMKRMVPIVLVVIALVLFLLLKSLRATVATLLSVFISTILAFGLMAVLSIPIYSVSTMIPVMLIAIGVAYGIYFYNHLNQYYLKNDKANRKEAISHVLKVLWKPLTMAAFTTMIGFISLLTSQVFPIKYFGIFTAFGIFASYVLALTFLPAMVFLFGYKPKNKKSSDSALFGSENLKSLTNVLLANKKLVYISVTVIILISIVGIQKVWINSSFLDKFEKNSEIVVTDEFVNSKFGGTSTLNLILESDEKNTFKNPEVLSLIDKMQSDAEELEKVGNSFSLSDYLKRMNKVMNSDKNSFFKIPENTNLIAQYLLLYEMSGDPENLTKVVNYDYNRTNITFQLKADDSKTINSALQLIDTYKSDFKEFGVDINYAGSGYKALIFTDLILEGQILSLAISLILVLILLSLMFRSIKAGLIGSLPIIITALISFGVMGLFNIPLSTTTALLSSIAIGIGIDYAIHFLQHYKMNLSDASTKKNALHLTMKQTGKAIIYNAIVVIAGFLVLLFSVFPPNRALGALVSMNMFTSLLGTLTIMMILVFTNNLFVKTKKTKDNSNNL